MKKIKNILNTVLTVGVVLSLIAFGAFSKWALVGNTTSLILGVVLGILGAFLIYEVQTSKYSEECID